MDDLLAIRDIAPPIESLPGWPAWPWVILSLLVLAVFIYYRKTRRNVITPEPVPETQSPLQSAIKALDVLLAEQLIEHGRTKLFFTKLNMILRIFLSEEFKFQALIQTTSELISSDVHSLTIDDNCSKLFVSFLRQCDLFKFADITAQPVIAREAHRSCLALVNLIDSNKEKA